MFVSVSAEFPRSPGGVHLEVKRRQLSTRSTIFKELLGRWQAEQLSRSLEVISMLVDR